MKNENMTEVLKIHLSPDQRTAINAAAFKAGVTVSEYVRSRTLAEVAPANSQYVAHFRVTPDSDMQREIVYAPSIFAARDMYAKYDYTALVVEKYDPRTEAERALDEDGADYDQTVKSVRPGGM